MLQYVIVVKKRIVKPEHCDCCLTESEEYIECPECKDILCLACYGNRAGMPCGVCASKRCRCDAKHTPDLECRCERWECPCVKLRREYTEQE